MSGYKEFEGKSLDEAIKNACAYFDAPREMLEVEIVHDAKGGIFGLVGARKAKVKARSISISKVMESLEPAQHQAKKNRGRDTKNQQKPASPKAAQVESSSQDDSSNAPASQSQPSHGRRPAKNTSTARTGTESTVSVAPTAQESKAGAGPKPHNRKNNKNHEQRQRIRPEKTGQAQSAPVTDTSTEHDEAASEDLPRTPLAQLDAQKLEQTAIEVTRKLVEQLLDEFTCSVEIHGEKLHISIHVDGEPGLLIGRDGQTLASIQYLASRMISNAMQSLIRVSVDAGDYRDRQDKRLRDLALNLAEKVKETSRPQLTRPLSSYHRRVIHMTLQDDPHVQTHSKGDGELKRVVVAIRRKPLEKHTE